MKDTILKSFESSHPDEKIIFTSAATFLETISDIPVGTSSQRLSQKRGFLIFTREKIFFTTGSFSISSVLYFLLCVYCLFMLFEEKNWLFIIPLVFFIIGIRQRWSQEKQISASEILDLKLEEASSLGRQYTTILVYVTGRVFQFVTAQVPGKEILESLKPKKV
jgi:hypothetical protein